MMGVAYPRRQDTVRYEQFDGTLESAQRIAALSQTAVHITVYYGPQDRIGDSLKEVEINEGVIKRGQMVVRKSDDRIEIFDQDAFHDKYSKDGN